MDGRETFYWLYIALSYSSLWLKSESDLKIQEPLYVLKIIYVCAVDICFEFIFICYYIHVSLLLLYTTLYVFNIMLLGKYTNIY